MGLDYLGMHLSSVFGRLDLSSVGLDGVSREAPGLVREGRLCVQWHSGSLKVVVIG